jgi:hypothetical protein
MSLLVSATYSDDSELVDWELQELEQKNKPLDLPHDALTLSCASHRLFLETGRRWQELAGCEPQEQDRVRAQEIRRHFQDRIMMRMLSDRSVSDFQRDLYDMLTATVREKHRGMLYRLPYLYQEDHDREQLRGQFQIPDSDTMYQFQHGGSSLRQDLTPVTQILRSRKARECWEYWFRQQEGYAVCWVVDAKNPLWSLVDGLYRRESFSLITALTPRSWHNITYLTPVQPVLA